MSETMSISHDYSGEYVEDVLVDSLQGILEVQSQLFPNNLEAGKLESESGEEDFQPLKWKVEVERKRWSNSKILKGGLVHSETNFEETTKIFDRGNKKFIFWVLAVVATWNLLLQSFPTMSRTLLFRGPLSIRPWPTRTKKLWKFWQ